MVKLIFADGTTISLEELDLPLEIPVLVKLTLTYESGITETVILPEVVGIVEEE